jgi:hypothetical protein
MDFPAQTHPEPTPYCSSTQAHTNPVGSSSTISTWYSRRYYLQSCFCQDLSAHPGPPMKLQSSRTAFRPHNLHLRISNLSTLHTCNQTVTTLHVSTNSQHVLYLMLAKHDHVATVVAGTTLLAGTVLLLRLHCYHQCNEDSNAHSHNTLILQKQICKIQLNLD